MKKLLVFCTITVVFFASCSDDNSNQIATPVTFNFSDYLNIDFNNLSNYALQTTPVYITKDNTVANPITNEGATLRKNSYFTTKIYLQIIVFHAVHVINKQMLLVILMLQAQE